MKRQIKIRIYADGHIESATQHIKGKECLKYLQPIAALLEARVTDSAFTSEYYETEEEQADTQTVDTSL